MDFAGNLNQLEDLPAAFKRFGPIFAGIITSISAALSRETRAIDQLSSQISLPTARWGWLDAIGKLYGIQRNQYENDPQFRRRLLGTLTANRGTPDSIINFIKLALNLNATITENFDLVSYQINFSNVLNQQVLQQVAIAINWVRPAGVPFLPLFVIKGGLYLNTLNYFGVKKVTGSYLAKPAVSIAVNLAANTNNPSPLLPTTYLTDPYITGVAEVNFPL